MCDSPRVIKDILSVRSLKIPKWKSQPVNRKKDRQYNGQNKKDQRKNYDLQKVYIKPKMEQLQAHQHAGMY